MNDDGLSLASKQKEQKQRVGRAAETADQHEARAEKDLQRSPKGLQGRVRLLGRYLCSVDAKRRSAVLVIDQLAPVGDAVLIGDEVLASLAVADDEVAHNDSFYRGSGGLAILQRVDSRWLH